MMLGQVVSDLATIGWVFLWVLIAQAVRRLVDLFAVPAQKTADLAASMSDGLSSAANTVGEVPAIGDKLRAPFDGLSSGLGSIGDYATSTVHMIHTAALVIAIIVFAVPVVIWLWKWLPGRVRFIVESGRANRLLRADGAIELFALRAMATAPMSDLARITSNPIGAWQAGDQDILRKLAVMELRRDGLALPKQRRGRRGGALTPPATVETAPATSADDG